MKINPAKLTEFETQLATMFELRIGDVAASPFELRVPDMPVIGITWWGAHVVPPQPGTTATWYRALTWRGKILARQLHRRALARPVSEKEPPDTRESAAPAGVANQQLLAGLQTRSAMKNYGVPNLFARSPMANPGTVASFYGVSINDLIAAGVSPSVMADAKKGIPSAVDTLLEITEKLQESKL